MALAKGALFSWIIRHRANQRLGMQDPLEAWLAVNFAPGHFMRTN